MSNPISTAAAQVIDRVLSNVARGYKQAGMFVFMLLFPIVMVNQRAPGSNIVDAEFGYSDNDYALQQYAINFKVPREHAEEATAVPGIQLGSQAVQKAMDIIMLGV